MKNPNTCFCCGYDLRGSTTPRCSECGFDPSIISNKEALRQSPLYPRLRRQYVIGASALLLAIVLNSIVIPVIGGFSGVILLVFSLLGIKGKTVLYEKPVRPFLFLYYSRRLIWLGLFAISGSVIMLLLHFINQKIGPSPNPRGLFHEVVTIAKWLWVAVMAFSIIMWLRTPSFTNTEYELCLHREFNSQQFLLSFTLQSLAIASAALYNLIVYMLLFAAT